MMNLTCSTGFVTPATTMLPLATLMDLPPSSWGLAHSQIQAIATDYCGRSRVFGCRVTGYTRP